MSDLPKLPLELIFSIIASLLGDPRTIHNPSHSSTKALLSFTLVCRATYSVATNYLREQCLYIDNDRRLRGLIHTVESTKHRIQGYNSTGTDIPKSLSIQPGSSLRPITNLYLSPFGSSIDDQPKAIWIRELFCLIHPTLRRLVVDIPLRSLYPADDHLNVRKTLREAFSLLTEIEEFVSVQDELYLDILEPEWRTEKETSVWTLWPKLKRLALYNVDADERFWKSVEGMRELDTVVLTRADGLESTCMKSEYFGSAIGSVAGDDTGNAAGEESAPPRPLKVVIVNIANNQPSYLAGRWKWDKVDPNNLMRVMTYDVPTSFYGDEDPIYLCQHWVKVAALRGDIWEWEGDLVKGGPRDGSGNALVFELEA
ncbi:hypothetical protein J7T55_008329 [Diaporthe amygdali]|uniref:uncharacterized protein n=1 Tax=Phomopsis amygdali TaxID=1214568 RepID=UPI0022FDB472|nr:uncharacterized protein J7T55_008329 [Diaporthe amygdali]KAJ0121167.1 hypothetical protein J7T55_008329 [Diaporthe amygdali]